MIPCHQTVIWSPSPEFNRDFHPHTDGVLPLYDQTMVASSGNDPVAHSLMRGRPAPCGDARIGFRDRVVTLLWIGFEPAPFLAFHSLDLNPRPSALTASILAVKQILPMSRRAAYPNALTTSAILEREAGFEPAFPRSRRPTH